MSTLPHILLSQKLKKEDAFGHHAALIILFIFSFTISTVASAQPPPSALARISSKTTTADRSKDRTNNESQTRNNTLTVAVIDTGIDETHPLLKDYLWVNPGESGNGKESNGVDDDGNGFVDDVHGWNFASNNNDLDDRHGHGTHISGIIIGVAGEAMLPKRRIRMMILKYYEQQQSPSTMSATTRAILYAIKMKADIINYSSGGYQKDREEFLALKKAEEQGILVIAAAGNDTVNTDRRPYYPANYPLQNVLSIASVETPLKRKPQLSGFSNYGKNSVDFATAGENILSTVPGGRLDMMSGTSQAAALACHLGLKAYLSQTRSPASESRMQTIIASFKLAASPSTQAHRAQLVAQVLNPNDILFKGFPIDENRKSRMITSSDFENSKLTKKKGLQLT